MSKKKALLASQIIYNNDNQKELLLSLFLNQFLSTRSYFYIPCLVLEKNLGRSLCCIIK